MSLAALSHATEAYWLQVLIIFFTSLERFMISRLLIFNMIAGSNDKSVIVWDLTGNLTVDSELSRNVGTKWFMNDPEKVS